MNKSWLPEYRICGIPETLEPYPDVPAHFFLEQAAREFPRLRCVQMGLEISYREINAHADRLAGGLSALGIRKGDRVATLLPTSIQFVVADAAISKAGGVHVPASVLEARDTLAQKFSECTPKALICLEEHLPTAEYLRLQLAALHTIITRLDDYSGHPSPTREVRGALWMGRIIAESPPLKAGIAFETAHDLETLLFTGGTTGIPKGCMLTHRNIVANALQNRAMFGHITKLFRGNIAVIMGLPFFHSYGHSLMHTMIASGYGMLISPDPRDTKAMLAMIRTYHPVFQVGVPTQFMNLLGEDLKRTKLIGISGSAALPPTVQQQFEKSSGGYITEGYGLSELSPVTHYNVSANIRAFGGRTMMRLLNPMLFNPASVAAVRALARLIGYRRFGNLFTSLVALMAKLWRVTKVSAGVERRATIGIPVPDTEIKVVEVESGAAIELEDLIRQDKAGEMCLKGPQRMLGYWPEPGKGFDPGGYVRTGDVVKVDRRGYFSIVDRTKDMVIVSGFKVYTREIDDLLYDHPATRLAAAIGVPDHERPGSERVMVFVELREEYQGSVTEEEYLQFLSGKVARYALPRAVTFLERIPLTTVDKVDKKALRELARNTAFPTVEKSC